MNAVDANKKSRAQLLELCKAAGIRGTSGKKKEDIIKLLEAQSTSPAPKTSKKTPRAAPEIYRLNYIGSKYQLIDWLQDAIYAQTAKTSFTNTRIADLFAGTGVLSHHFRKSGATVLANDAELYSAIITHAFTLSTYSEACKTFIESANADLAAKKHVETVGFITRNYSPYEDCERKFFTVDNAQRIDYIRAQIESKVSELPTNDYKFLLASLLLAADAVSNVPAVYGCYLKNFKAKANKPLVLAPIHTLVTAAAEGSAVTNKDVLSEDLLSSVDADIVYLDPPYNERQYSKNYFPLNMVALSPDGTYPELRGKTGIPSTCFLSPFCQKAGVEGAFDKLFRCLRAKYIFVSYNSESLLSKVAMITLMEKYGTATVLERSYKRFKSFEYNKDVDIQEYLFCLKKRTD